MSERYAIKNIKSGKYVRDFSNGCRFTIECNQIEFYTSKKAAINAAREYGRTNGAGYKVVRFW